MTVTSTTYSFKKSETFSLDDIFEIQGLGGGDWWEKTGEDLPEHLRHDIGMSESLICTKTIKITITVDVKK